MVFFLATAVQAQVTVNINIGTPPPWGPVGYTEVRYYYLPDVEAYYDIQASMFIYYVGGTWVHRDYLPKRYRSYDLYGGYKVVMTDYRGDAPYTYFNEHKTKYSKGYHGQSQKTIGERPGEGNSNGESHYKGHSDKSNSQGNEKSDGHGHDKNMKKDHGDGNGKKK
jgi:hypothetical protein